MYKVENVSLEVLFKKYNVPSLRVLDEAKLQEFAQEAKVEPQWEFAKGTLNRIRFDRLKTEKAIMKAYTYDWYMSSDYWEEPQLKIVAELKLRNAMKSVAIGSETYALLQDAGLGFTELEPGQTVNVDWTDRYVVEVMLKHPLVAPSDGKPRIRITNIENNRPIGETVEIAVSDSMNRADVVQTLHNRTWALIKELAKKNGVVYVGRNKEQIRDSLADKYMENPSAFNWE